LGLLCASTKGGGPRDDGVPKKQMEHLDLTKTSNATGIERKRARPEHQKRQKFSYLVGHRANLSGAKIGPSGKGQVRTRNSGRIMDQSLVLPGRPISELTKRIPHPEDQKKWGKRHRQGRHQNIHYRVALPQGGCAKSRQMGSSIEGQRSFGVEKTVRGSGPG